MEMTYGGALVMPSNYAMMDAEEMMYLEGGDTSVITGTAKKLKEQAAVLMAAWWSLTAGYSYTAAAAASTVVGAGFSFAALTGAGYCGYVASQYTTAYNYFSTKSQTASKKYKMTTISLLGIVTGVEFGEK